MKKTSRFTIGIDLGDEYSQVCVLDADGDIIDEGKVRTSEAAIRARFGGMKPALTVLEVGTHSPWISRLLEELGHQCLVASPNALHRKNGRKSDRIDAERLARKGRADPEELEPVEHASAAVQADMAIVHSRRSLVESRTKLINRCRGLVKSWGGRLPKCDAEYFARRMGPYIPAELEVAVAPLLQTIALLTAQIKEFDTQIEALAAGKYGEATRHMREVLGIGPITSLAYVLTIREPGRFRRSRQVGPYLGMTPRQDQSGEMDREHGISKAGNVYLRALLIQSAHYVLERGPDTDIKRWGLKLAERGGKKGKRRAVVAVARKLALLLHHLWLKDEEYRALREADSLATPSVA
jgi:transposase